MPNLENFKVYELNNSALIYRERYEILDMKKK